MNCLNGTISETSRRRQGELKGENIICPRRNAFQQCGWIHMRAFANGMESHAARKIAQSNSI